MKKIRNTIIGLAGIAAAAALVGCDSTSNSNTSTTSAEETRTVLAQEGISALNTITMVNATSAQKSMTYAATNVDMDEILALVEKANILAEDKLTITVSESDRDGYVEKQTLSYGDNEYYLYVTTKITDSDDEDEDDDLDDDEDEDDDDDEDEVEEETKYTGIIVDGENEYTFVAEEEYEAEDDEVESEFKMTVALDEYTTVIIEQENEVEGDETETEFSCKYKTNGKTTTAYSVKTEVEDNESKIKITENGSTYKLKYYTKNNTDYLKVKMEGSYEVKFSLSQDESGNVVYTLVDED